MHSEITVVTKILMVSLLAPTTKEHSASSHLQGSFRQACAFEFESGSSIVDLLEVVLGQLDIHRAEVFLEAMLLGCSWDRHDPRLLCQQPTECDLRRCRAFALRNGLDQVDQNHIGLARLR